MISIASGLQNSLIVLEFLRGDEELKDADIYVRCFMNCRECGLTFTNWNTEVTYCIYEHRNSDGIIINSKKNWTGLTGDLPYKEGTKWDYDKAFAYDQHYKCYLWLKKKLLQKRGGKND